MLQKFEVTNVGHGDPRLNGSSAFSFVFSFRALIIYYSKFTETLITSKASVNGKIVSGHSAHQGTRAGGYHYSLLHYFTSTFPLQIEHFLYIPKTALVRIIVLSMRTVI